MDNNFSFQGNSIPPSSTPPVGQPPPIGSVDFASPQPPTPPATPRPAPPPQPEIEIQQPVSQVFNQSPTSPINTSPKIKVLFMLIPFFAVVTASAVSMWLINSKKNETVTYQSSAAEVKPTIAPLAASQSGCVFSLRYDTSDAVLKQEALNEIEKIKARVEKGEKAENIVYEITTSSFKYKDSPATNPYSKFNVNQAFNFCFSDEATAENLLGQNFLSQNPVFKENLKNQNPPPFNIIDNNKQDYAWMMIIK